MKNIWTKLVKKKPFICLAPMAGVTDFAFREILCGIGNPACKRRGKPDVFFTEFVSTEMIVRNFLESPRSDLREYPEIRSQKFRDLPPILKFSKKQHPIIVQFFGCNPEQFEICARLAVKLGFDGIDINMGCPDRKVQKQGAGSELIRNPELAREIVCATIHGCGGKIPVSIKTRLGYDEKDIARYLGVLKDIVAEGGISAITIHGRTVKQGYSGETDWEAIGEITKEIKKKLPKITVIGNGDVKNLEQGKMLAEKYGVDGVMIGRAVLKNPWLFSGKENVSLKTRLKIALKHTKIFEKFYNSEHYGSTPSPESAVRQEHGVSIGVMKKYYKGYFSGVAGDSFDKKGLMEARSIEEAKMILISKY